MAALAPGARIVKAFNSIVTARFNEGPVKNGGRRVIFVSGDHPEPTAFIKQLIESFGFTAIDLGDLATGGRLQQAGGPLAVATSSNSAITNTGGAECVQCKSELSASRDSSSNLPTFPNLQHRPSMELSDA